MTLNDLLKCLDTGDEEHTPEIQIVTGGNDWEQYDQLRINSELLKAFYEREVECMAVEDGELRVGLRKKKVCTLLHLCL